MNERPRLIEKGTKHVADEAYIKSWWIFSYNNKIYKIDEYQSVDDTTNRGFEQSKFQITNNYQKVIK
jgi:CMP-N-acetylneuraminic acid synthetase